MMRKRAAPSCEFPPHTRGDVGALFGQSNRSTDASTGSGVRPSFFEILARTPLPHDDEWSEEEKLQAISPLAPPAAGDDTAWAAKFHSDTHRETSHAVLHGLSHASTHLFFPPAGFRIVIFGLGDSSGWTAMAMHSRARLGEVPVYELAAANPHTTARGETNR